MPEEIKGKRFKEVLKHIIKRRGHKYQQVAELLGVSLPTVKRILNQDDLSFERLLTILDWLGLSLGQLAELVEKQKKVMRGYYSEKQQEFLASHLHHMYIYTELAKGRSRDDLRQKFNLTHKSVEKYLFDLDRYNLIELLPGGKVRLLKENPMLMAAGGILFRTVMKKSFAVLMREQEKYGNDIDNPKITTDFRAQLPMRAETYAKMRTDMTELIDRYDSASKVELAVEARENLVPVFYYGIGGWTTDLRTEVYGSPRNFE